MDRIDYRQTRAARGLLGWTQKQLADAAGVSLATIQFFETNKREPIPNNLIAIRRALEDTGIVFQKDGKNIGVSISIRKLPK
jgi:transcriptional regulator with XRE-family HTH domain